MKEEDVLQELKEMRDFLKMSLENNERVHSDYIRRINALDAAIKTVKRGQLKELPTE